MDCYYISYIEKGFMEYLEEHAEDTEDCYVWIFVEDEDAPRVMDINVKNMQVFGNREAVLLQIIYFFEINGKNYYHQLFNYILKEFSLETISDIKNFGLDKLFSAMTAATFDCEGTRLVLRDLESESEDEQ